MRKGERGMFRARETRSVCVWGGANGTSRSNVCWGSVQCGRVVG